MIPGGGVAVVCGFHGAVVVVAAVNLGVAVIEAAAGVEVVAVDDPVLPFGLIVAMQYGGIEKNLASIIERAVNEVFTARGIQPSFIPRTKIRTRDPER